jgi:signal transduction protein with GAF and PtsI domain
MAPLCEPFSPALYRLLVAVVKACDGRGKPVTLCGEMASRPVCFMPLLGMGLRSLSMSPIIIPAIREMARHVTLAKAKAVLEHLIDLKSAKEIRRHLSDALKEAWPSAALLDTQDAPDGQESVLPAGASAR